MTKKIKLLKLASQRQDILSVKKEEEEIILLEYLKKIKQYPIASSCNGEGVCKKCVFNNDLLLCETKVIDSPSVIRISYL